MPLPSKPAAPPQALRSNPETFSANTEASIQYQFGSFPEWIEAVATFVESEADEAAAAAAAAGAAEGFDLTGKGGAFLRAKLDETGIEVAPLPNLTSLGGLTLAAGQGVYASGVGAFALFPLTAQGRSFLAAANQPEQRTALGIGAAALSDFTPVEQGGGAGMGGNKIRVGWGGAGNEKFLVQVDSSAPQKVVLEHGGDSLSLPTGVIRLSNKLFWQWGKTVVGAGATVNASLPFSFPVSALVPMACPVDTSVADPDSQAVSASLTTTQITLKNSAGSAREINWYALGY